MIYGEFDTDLLRINGTLDVNNAYQFPTADGASGQLLQTNGSGALSWTDVIGGASDIDGLTDGRTIDGSVYLGAGAGAVDDGTANKNVAIGISAMGSNTFGFLNTATGYEALTSNIGGNRNTANGYQALYTNSSGNYNTALGYQTLFTNSSGDCNVAVGDYALYHTTVNYSTAIGFDALYTSSSGEENTAVGYYAGRSNTTGSFNTVSGSRALYTNSTGSGNTASGYKAAYSNTSGTYNTAIGYESNLSQQGGSYNTTVGAEAGKTSVNHNKTGNVFIGYGAGRNVAANSNYNVFIGYEAGENLIANNLLYIENSNSALPLIYGDFEDDVVHINGELWVRSYYHFPTSTGSNGQIMKTNGTGTASWANIQIDELTDAKSDATNVFLGSGAGEDNNGTDHENVGVGINALTNNSTGEYNTAVGKSAMSNNVSGSSNTAVGWAAGPGYGHNSLTNTSAFGREASVVASNEISIGNGSVSWIGGNVTWSTFSDERGKNSIKEDVKGLDFIMKLRPVTYHIDKDKLDAIKGIKDNSYYPEKYDIEKIKQTGFLAQEVESAAKESNYDFSGVKAPVNENKPYSISYAEFVVPLVKAVQEQQLVIEELKKEIEELKSLSQNN